MRSLLILSLTTAVFLDDIQPKTSYTAERELLIESECTLDMSQVVFEISPHFDLEMTPASIHQVFALVS